MSIRSKYFLMFFGIPLVGLGVLLLVMTQLYADNKRLDLLDSHLTQLTHVADAVAHRIQLMQMDTNVLESNLKSGVPVNGAPRGGDFLFAMNGGSTVAQTPDVSEKERVSRVRQLLLAQPKATFLIDKNESYLVGRRGSLVSVYGLSRELEEALPKDVTTVRLADDQGLVVASTLPSEVGQPVQSLLSPADYRALGAAGASRGSFESQGREGQMVSFSNVKSTPLLLIASTPKFSILRASQMFVAQGVGSLFALLGLAALASIYFSNSLGSRFRGLVKVMDAVQRGDFAVRAPIGSRDEIGELAAHLNRTAEQLGVLVESKTHAARIDEELRTAKIVQENLFPPSLNRTAGTLVVGEYQPASEVSGDWWFTFSTADKVFVLVADVTGHGIAAALMTSAAKAGVSMLDTVASLTPARLLKELNRVILQTSRGEKQMTMFAIAFDLAKRELMFSNASHELPYVVGKTGSVEPLLATSGLRLGESLEATYTDQSCPYEEGSMLVLFTDGIYELQNEKDRTLSERAFTRMLKTAKASSTSAESFLANLKGRLAAFHAKPQLNDDITLVVFGTN